MRFTFHPDAVTAFTAQSSELVRAVQTRLPQRTPGTKRFDPQVHVSAHFKENDILGPIETSQTDRDGKTASRFMGVGGTLFGLDEQGCSKLRKLAEAIQKAPAFRDRVSVRFLENTLFRWCVATARRAEASSACDYVAAESEKAVERIETWVPVYGLHIQSPFAVGRVVFKTITKEMLDSLHQRILERVAVEGASGDPAIMQALERRRKELQGFAAATVEPEAEPIRAEEIAGDLADKATSVLRFFAPANFDHRLVSYCVPLGKHQRAAHHYLFVEDGKIISASEGVSTHGLYPWVIDDAYLSDLQSAGLTAVGNLFAKHPKSILEQIAFEAILLHSKAALVSSIPEKLLYIFAALESALLRNSNEPITQNVGERLGFLAGADADSRIRISKVVTEAYAVRSAFVHHGKRDEHYDPTQFMMAAWNGLHALLRNTATFTSKDELLDAIERHKYR
jgi:hypothetical protein